MTAGDTVGRPPFVACRDHFIGGDRVASSSGETVVVVDPFTERPIGEAPAGVPADVDAAVEAATVAGDEWASIPVSERCEFLDRLADELEGRRDEIAVLIASEVGTPLRHAYAVQADLPVADLRATTEAARQMNLEETVGSSSLTREPVGAVAAITPWNFPLHQIVGKLAGALAAGCTVVLKPSELAPLNASLMAEACQAAGLPAGTVNVVFGSGREVGATLADHPGIDMVSFTGSTAAGRAVAGLAAKGVKKTALELGGKSTAVVLDDADLEGAVRGWMGGALLNAGQTCNAHTRLLVPRSVLADVEELAVETARRFTCGDPFDAGTRLGPLISTEQRHRVRGRIKAAEESGARLLAGGIEPPEGVQSGYFVTTTIFSDVDPRSELAQEEVFGPVLAILAYDIEEEAIEIANGTQYGLSAGVWSADPERAAGIARRLRAGQVDLNGATFNPGAPFGGVRGSGYGREFGKYGVEEFTTWKSIQK